MQWQPGVFLINHSHTHTFWFLSQPHPQFEAIDGVRVRYVVLDEQVLWAWGGSWQLVEGI